MVRALPVATLLLAGPASLQEGSSHAFIRRDTTFAYFGGDTVRVELVELRVPERYDLADSDSSTVRALVFPSTAPEPGPPVFYLAGGPGSSAFRDARGMQEIVTTLQRDGPFVAIAQRGTWGSEPYLACPQSARYPDDRPLTWAGFENVVRDAAQRCVAHWVEKGVDLRGYHTRAIARDLEDLRRALNYEQVDLWAVSYGTQVALDVIRTFPESVRRAVLVSLHRPDAAVALPADAELDLTILESLWRQHPVFGRPESSVRSILRRALQELQERPARVMLEDPVAGNAEEVVVGPYDLQLVVSHALRRRGSVQGGLPDLLLGLLDGDLARLAAWSRVFRRWNGNAMALAVGCATGLPADFTRRARAQADTLLLGTAPSFSELEACDVVPHADLGAELRTWFRSEVPILFIDPGLGTETSAFADSLAAWMPRSRRLHVHWGFHAELEPWERFAPPISAFFQGHELPYDTIALPPPMPPTARERLEAVVWAVGEMERRALLTPEVAGQIRALLQPILPYVERDGAEAIRLLGEAIRRIVSLARGGDVRGDLASGALIGPLEAVARELQLADAARP